MNNYDLSLPQDGSATRELMEKSHKWWAEAIRQPGLDVSKLSTDVPLAERLAVALAAGLTIATLYSRFSTKKQGSTEDQVRVGIEYAARNGMYVPPEFICVDEGWKGRKDDRPGLNRIKLILQRRIATVLLVFKLSRLYRQVHSAIKFVQEDVVDEGLRAVAVTQGVDTNDKKTWKFMVAMHGTMDESLLDAIGDHVRESLVTLFLNGFRVGALALGYRPKEVPGAPPTRRGHPRTMPEVDPAVAERIREHFQLIRGGMQLADGWKKWRQDKGPKDPRCKTPHMSYGAYHRMLSRLDYIGIVKFCRKRNHWVSKRDTLEQQAVPPDEVKKFQCEELRIVDDETFWAVQEILNKLKTGTRKRRNPSTHEYHVWDLFTHLFRCPHCVAATESGAAGYAQRFYATGARNQYFHCPNPECPAPAMVNRKDAAEALCAGLSKLLRDDPGLIELILSSFAGLDAGDVDQLDEQIKSVEREVRNYEQKLRDLEDLLGAGTEDDRARRKAQILAAQRERTQHQLNLAQLRRRRGGGKSGAPVTRQQVEQSLANLLQLLDDAAAGRLGKDVVGKAVSIIERLVGGVVWVHATRRPGRKRWQIRGRFTPQLIETVRADLGADASARAPGEKPGEIEVWLRPPPRLEWISDEVHQLYEVDKLGFRMINKRLEEKYRQKIGTGNCCLAYRRWYEIRNLPIPERRTNTGRPRKRSA